MEMVVIILGVLCLEKYLLSGNFSEKYNFYSWLRKKLATSFQVVLPP